MTEHSAPTVRYFVEDRVRKNRSKQPADTAVVEWYHYEAHERRGPENDVQALQQFNAETAALAAKWREWAAIWRDLAGQLCAYHHCAAKELPPPGSRKRPRLTAMQQVQRDMQTGRIVSTQELESARQWDEMQAAMAQLAERYEQRVRAGLVKPHVSYVASSIAVDRYLEHVDTPIATYRYRSWSAYYFPFTQEEWEAQAPLYVASVTPKHAALVAGHLLDVAGWLERAANAIDAIVKQPLLRAVR